MHVRFACLAPDLYAQSVLINKIFASELSREVYYKCVVGWEGSTQRHICCCCCPELTLFLSQSEVVPSRRSGNVGCVQGRARRRVQSVRGGGGGEREGGNFIGSCRVMRESCRPKKKLQISRLFFINFDVYKRWRSCFYVFCPEILS